MVTLVSRRWQTRPLRPDTRVQKEAKGSVKLCLKHRVEKSFDMILTSFSVAPKKSSTTAGWSGPWVLITHDSWTAGVGSPHCCLYHQPDLGCLVISGRVDRHSDSSQPTGTSWLTVFADVLWVFFFFYKSFFCQVKQWFLWTQNDFERRLKTFLPVEVCKDCCSVLIKAFGGLTHGPDDVQSMSKACWRLNYYSF